MGWREWLTLERPVGRRPMLGILAAAAGYFSARSLLAEAAPDQPVDGPGGQLSRLSGTTSLREGSTLVQVAGQFRITGARIVFEPQDGGRKYVVLENLGLERVGRALEDAPAPDSLCWTVSGKITEYRGANYLLLTHAVTQDQGPPDEGALP